MTSLRRRPPGLLVRSVAITFVTASVLVAIIFGVVVWTVRDEVRETIRVSLESSQQVFAALQAREQRLIQLQATTAAESPTLKAAVDTYAAEYRSGDGAVRAQLLATVHGELEKIAARVLADAIVIVDAGRTTLAAAGPFASAWRVGEPAPIVGAPAEDHPNDGVVHTGASTFRVVVAPLLLSEETRIGSLYLATSLDRRFARQLGSMARAHTAILSRGSLVASTLPEEVQRQFEAAASDLGVAGTRRLGGESYEFQQLFRVSDTSFYALTSIDAAARQALGATTRSLLFVAAGAMSLALLASVAIAHHLSKPIGQLSTSLYAMAKRRRFDEQLPLTGSSRELDELTDTFNALMASVAAAEAETKTAYTAAIRALAATLDARDPYTAGHSERVSVLSAAIGRAMNLSDEDLEVLRLGALLHDIGKIGVPDEVLRKPGALTSIEFEAIKQHTVLGARILKHVPFLAPHVPIVELHHERPDGRGYPHGLVGDAIPLAARIVHVADAYDAMTSARAYRSGRPSGDAVRELLACIGSDFHGDVVRAFVAALPGVPLAIRQPILESHVA
jgi:putative nucleotidyltransferase with HDIG domain